jgi:hypothetical protein
MSNVARQQLFYPGMVPRGWTRGEEIEINMPPVAKYGPRAQGTVAQRWLGFSSDLSAPAPTDTVVMVITMDDMPGVREWLKWWQEPEPETPQLTSMFKDMLTLPEPDKPATRLLK